MERRVSRMRHFKNVSELPHLTLFESKLNLS